MAEPAEARGDERPTGLPGLLVLEDTWLRRGTRLGIAQQLLHGSLLQLEGLETLLRGDEGARQHEIREEGSVTYGVVAQDLTAAYHVPMHLDGAHHWKGLRRRTAEG